MYRLIVAMVNIYNRTHKNNILSVSTLDTDAEFFIRLTDLEESLPFDDDNIMI